MDKAAKVFVAAVGEGLAALGPALRAARIAFEEPGLATGPGATRSAFCGLRLEGEEMLVALVQEGRVREAADILRRGAHVQVFCLASLEPRSETPARAAKSVGEHLGGLERRLLRIHGQLRDLSDHGHLASPAAQWLLDNCQGLRAHVSTIREALSRNILAHVPRDPQPGGLPAVAAIANRLVEDSDGVVSEDRIVDAILAAQAGGPLLVDEIWLLPALIRLALVDLVAKEGEAVRAAQQLRETAHFWSNRIASATRAGDRERDRMLQLLAADPVADRPAFVVGVAERLQEEDRALVAYQTSIEAKLDKGLGDLVSRQHQDEALQGVRIANAFHSLRALNGVDFVQVFEKTSHVELELNQDRDSIYAHSDADTRNRARRAVQEIARASGGRTETEVARAAVLIATEPQANVLTYLIADGRPLLEKQMGASPDWTQRFERSARKHATTFYIASILALTLVFFLVALSLTIELGAWRQLVLLPLWILALFPLSELATQIVNMLVISVVQPRPLPKMDFKTEIPVDRSTLVVVPMMLVSHDVLRGELEKLEIRYLANPEENVYFSLLADFADASAREQPADAALAAALVAGVDALNAKYPNKRRFLGFRRDRTWSESEQAWIGRERKRGKIEELNAYLLSMGARAGGDSGLRVAGELPSHPIRYVITLDADTQLPPKSARRLIETIAHPLNQVVLDERTKVRRRGFAIIQPRVSISLPGSTATRFTRITGDPHGTDPYCRLVSDAQQDLFGHAIFHGKAIYDVAAFSESLDNRFPAERILSHDLIEGAYCGVGLATDIELFESMPLDYASYSRRQHRWIRGDWQIAPWMLPKVTAEVHSPAGAETASSRVAPRPAPPRTFENLSRATEPDVEALLGPAESPASPAGAAPRRMANPLSAINRWRIFDNLRRSLVAPASVALLLAGWFVSATPLVWTLVLTVAIAIPALAMLLDHIALRLQGSVSGGRGSYDELVRAVVSLFFLPHQAWLSLDAIGRSAYRMLFSRRNLLEWQTAEGAGRLGDALSSATMRQLTAISAVSAVLAILQARMQQGSAMPLLILWSGAPLLMRWLARPLAPELLDDLDAHARIMLRELARRTWRFFDDLVGPQTNWLPPDNTQLAVRIEVADRTSPTNIGLWLNSALAAHDFGYLTPDVLRERLTSTISTMERMEKHEGHLLNWYRASDLAPLAPRYLSTVDSGNLIASLWVVQQGCRQMIESEPLTGSQVWHGLADTFGNLRAAAGPNAGAAFDARSRALEPESAAAKAPGQAEAGASRRRSPAAFEMRALRRLLRAMPGDEELPAKARVLSELADRVQAALGSSDAETSYWAGKLCQETVTWVGAIERYYSWLEVLVRHPDSRLRGMGGEWPALRRAAVAWRPSIAALADGESPVDALLQLRDREIADAALASWLDDLQAEFARARAQARAASAAWRDLAARAGRLAQAVNMTILFDAKRKLFGIGYAVGGPVEFHGHYDLLASECRIASLVSIAKGDVPFEHWARLGRARTQSPSGQTLLSWSGTMFEYLMPLLFIRSYPNSLLQQACRDAVSRQIAHGVKDGLPWGVSESAHSAIDAGGTYQYHAFGIPELSLRGNTDSDRVVAPYATALALQVDPRAAIDNLEELEDMGLDGPMGFYEAIDFTQKPAPESDAGVIIYCYMAHHQGMSLLAIDNLLNDGAIQRRFHGDFRIRAIESLLFERIPNSPLANPEEGSGMAPQPAKAAPGPVDRSWTERTPVPRVQFLGNGRMSVAVTNSGAGYCRWNEYDISRWRSDAANDPWGSYLILRDVRDSGVWSATHQPVGGDAGTFAATFSVDRATFHRKAYDIESTLEVAVSPENDAEVRRLRVTNWSSRPRAIDVTTYMELALASHAADRAHPAFSKMFVHTESPERGVLIATRRKRSPEEKDIWVAQVLAGPVGAISFETDREIFLGRGNSLESADGFSRSLRNTEGSVVDPIFSLRCRLNIGVAGRAEISLVTLAADSREALMALVAKHRRPQAIDQALELVWNRAQLDLRYLRIGPEDVHRFQNLGSALLYPDPSLRGPVDRIARDRLGVSALWAQGISGDLPILAVTVADLRSLGLLREVLLAHKYLRLRGLQFDLVILNQEPVSYDRPLHDRIQSQVDALTSEPGGGAVYVLDWQSLSEAAVNQILAVAHVFLRGSRGGLQNQFSPAPEVQAAVRSLPASSRGEEPSRPLPFLELPYFNGLGGFTKDGREYAVYLGPGMTTPAPWANVMAHESFGAMVTESGLGFTWRGNSQASRLTPWHNDPVGDPQSEVIYLRDEESGMCWTPTAQPVRERDAYRARHGQGYTVFEHNSHAIGQELTVFVPISKDGAGENVKIFHLKLRNHSSSDRKLTATLFAELVLGTSREERQLRVSTTHDASSGAVFASQWWTGPGAGDVAFVASSPRPDSHTGDRLQFLGRNRGASKPQAMDRIRLDDRTGAGLDPAGAVRVSVSLPIGGEAEVVFLLGQCSTAEECRELIARFKDARKVEESLAQTKAWWDGVLDQVTVRTPVLSVDLLLNRWLLYQSLSCRFWARSAFYQSGGAIGFRDQLQDSLAMLYALPHLTRRHILTAAGRQFEQGDVQHWWHPDTGLGVRTRCSDDLLWLPFVVAHYVEVTGDAEILKQRVDYLTAPELAPHEHEKMFVPGAASESGTLLEHCMRAIAHAGRTGAHGLPLMGNGDWNDGMNLVGPEGRGESVWLAWFLCSVLRAFAAVLDEAGEAGGAELRAQSEAISAAVEASCWDGDWYLRAFFDSGEKLGSAANSEARIDSLAQSWSVISGMADPARAARAVESAHDLLVDRKNKLVKLFTPPFDKSRPHPGYIMGYPPGLRENGGQYTHGSLWLAMAFARLHSGGRAARLLQLMNPVEQTRTAADLARYCGEPYVVAADVSAAPGRLGRSGWTWYTGSAAWMYRIWLEEVLGITVRRNRLFVRPELPADWDGYSFTYRFGTASYEVEVAMAGPEVGLVEGNIELVDDGQTHRVRVSVLRRVTSPAVAEREREPEPPE